MPDTSRNTSDPILNSAQLQFLNGVFWKGVQGIIFGAREAQTTEARLLCPSQSFSVWTRWGSQLILPCAVTSCALYILSRKILLPNVNAESSSSMRTLSTDDSTPSPSHKTVGMQMLGALAGIGCVFSSLATVGTLLYAGAIVYVRPPPRRTKCMLSHLPFIAVGSEETTKGNENNEVNGEDDDDVPSFIFNPSAECVEVPSSHPLFPHYKQTHLIEYVPNQLWIAQEAKKFAGIRCGSRMTIINLTPQWGVEKAVFLVYSPIPLTTSIYRQISDWNIAYIIAPNLMHQSAVHEWHKTFPSAILIAAPRCRKRTIFRNIPYHYEYESVDPYSHDFRAPLERNKSTQTSSLTGTPRTSSLVSTDMQKAREIGRLPSIRDGDEDVSVETDLLVHTDTCQLIPDFTCPWKIHDPDEAVLDYCIFRAGTMHEEIVLFHKPSKTLIVSDMITNMGHKPETSTLEMRFFEYQCMASRAALPTSIKIMSEPDVVHISIRPIIAWNFERIILAHGRLIEQHAMAFFKAAYAFVL